MTISPVPSTCPGIPTVEVRLKGEYVGAMAVNVCNGAREVGTTGVGALWGFGDERELTESGAVALAATPTDLLRIFE